MDNQTKNELKLLNKGSIVEVNGASCVVSSVNFPDISNEPPHNTFCIRLNDCETVAVNNRDCFGIQLNDKILRSLGFKKEADSYIPYSAVRDETFDVYSKATGNNRCFKVYKDNGAYYYSYPLESACNGASRLCVNFVHELQNIYKYIVREELVSRDDYRYLDL